MNFSTAIVLIVVVVMAARVLQARYEARGTAPSLASDPDARRLRDEVNRLKDRIAVLERLATDENNAARLDREIEKLRDNR
ncbi:MULTISPECIES: hypothetical protein [unclassified Sphingomonas]|uniref:hypothetical protein n=1 Tax=unclassified Sphingomonas TaxID=196159 RepID=UPI000BCA30BB|nr:MAG: hypothetical protein B7Y98_06905 [Sphingomonas sp. 32-62-10]